MEAEVCVDLAYMIENTVPRLEQKGIILTFAIKFLLPTASGNIDRNFYF